MASTGAVFPELRDYRFVNLYTFRKSGEAVPTTVWFAIDGERLYVATSVYSGKVKRIRNFPDVVLEPSDQRGTPLGGQVAGIARVVQESTTIQHAQAILNQRYGWFKQAIDTAYFVVAPLRGRKEIPTVIEIVPADPDQSAAVAARMQQAAALTKQAAPATARTAAPTATIFPHLHGHQYANLTTYRKSGVAVPTPVWFAIEPDAQGQEVLYVVTGADSGKVKRIRNNPRVALEPSDQRGKTLGPSADGQARIISDPAEAQHAKAALDRKYGVVKRIFDLVVMQGLGRLRNKGKLPAVTYLAIVPAT